MTTLAFSSEEALIAALVADVVPAGELALPVEHWRDEKALWIRPEEGVSASALERLATMGVRRSTRRAPSGARRVGSWLEAVAPIRDGEPADTDGAALFSLRDDVVLLDVAAELIRLGCDRQRYLLVEPAPLLLVDAPPYYTLLRAVDGGPVTAFAPSGRRNVWIEVGWAHPLASRIAAPEGRILMVSPRGWSSVPDSGWEDIDKLVEVQLPGTELALASREMERRIMVTPRLAPTGRMRSPALWVVRERALVQLERMLNDLPSDVLDGLLFAAGALGEPEVVVLRARAGSPAVELALIAERYAAHAQLPALMLPCDASLEPPLSRARLRALLEPEERSISWLRPTGGGRFVLEHAREDAFRPLGEWVDYVIHRGEPAIEPWVRSAVFDLEVLERAEAPAEASALRSEPSQPSQPSPARRAARPRAAAEPGAVPKPARVRTDRSKAALALEALERRFVDLDVAADAEERLALWLELAAAYAAVGRPGEAAHGFMRVLWERGSDPDLARAWLNAEGFGGDLADLLRIEWPSRDDMRALVALVESMTSLERAELEKLALFVDAHQDTLDVRGRWLIQLAVSRATGGDPLRLTRVRDRALADLRGGLSLDHDVPAFLRARATGHGDVHVAWKLTMALERLWLRYTTTKRKRSIIEAPEEITRTYARRLFAFGFARLGQLARAQELMAETDAIDKTDPVHGVLIRIFDERARHAMEGLSQVTRLSSELTAAMSQLEPMDRYKIDSLRESSRVLEPIGRLTSRRRVLRPDGDESVEGDAESVVIRACADETSPADRARLLERAMDSFYALSVSQATALLDRIVVSLDPVEPPSRARLLEQALVLAAHFGNDTLVDKLSRNLLALMSSLGPEHAADVGIMLERTLRALRRVGLKEHAAALLDGAARLARGDAPEMLTARVHLAGGLLYLGETAQAEPILAAAREALAGEPLLLDRLALTRAVAEAVALMPAGPRIALVEELAEQLAGITDMFSTNTHFCQSVLHFMESLITGLVPAERGRDGPAAAYLDEDEHLVRRRIHRDLREALS